MAEHLRTLIVEPDSRAGHWLYALTLARALSRRAVIVRLATLSPFDALEGVGEIPITIIGSRPQSATGTVWHHHHRVLEHARKIRRVVCTIREFKPDIVHLHGPLGILDFCYFRIFKRLGARVVYTAHDLRPSRWGLFNRLRYHAADTILVHSANSVVDLRKYGVDESMTVLIPHVSVAHLVGDGFPSREEAKASLGLPPGARAVLFFGYIAARKGLDLLIDAHAQLMRTQPHSYLIIAGHPSEDFTPYMERIAVSGVSDRVILDLRFIPLERMRVYFSAADVVVLPYRKIYQSGVLQWAYAFGRPVVVTNVGGIGEAVAADGTGLVVAPRAEALAGGILSLLTNEKLANAMGGRAVHVARTKYSWESVSDKVVGVYRMISSSPAQERPAGSQ